MNLTKPVAPTLRGYLVAFDGTWNREKDEDGVERFYAAYTADPRYDGKYYAGVGNAQDHKDGGGQLFHGAIGQFDANAIVDRAYNETVAFYQDPAHRTTPLDIVGFSRGAFQATKFATMISSGLTDNTTGAKFSVIIRYVGLISPVAMMNGVAAPLIGQCSRQYRSVKNRTAVNGWLRRLHEVGNIYPFVCCFSVERMRV